MLICFKSNCIPTPARALQREEEKKRRREEENKRILISIKKHALRAWSKRSKGTSPTILTLTASSTARNHLRIGDKKIMKKQGLSVAPTFFNISFTFSGKNFGILKFIIIFATKLDKSKMQLSLGLNGNI